MNGSDLFAPADPLAGPTRAERVNYATGVLLQAEDFQDEQTYHRRRLALALRHLAGFGTLAGLAARAPEATDNELELRVEPGLALDRWGRLIELAEPWCIRLGRWFDAQSGGALRAALASSPPAPMTDAVIVDLFLSAQDCGRGKTPSLAQGPFDALDALVPARLAEEPKLELVLRAEGAGSGVPAPKNHWPAPSASRETKLAAVLGAWDIGLSDEDDEGLGPLEEHVRGREPSAVLLARISIPVTKPSDGAKPPLIDRSLRVRVDNGLRPFIYLPGKWLGRAPDSALIVEPKEP